MQKFGLLGGGSQADETEEYCAPGSVLFRAISAQYLGESAREGFIDIATVEPQFIGAPVTAAVGAPGLRRQLVSSWAGTEFHTVVADGTSIGRSVELGDGCIVAPGAVLTYRARLGRHVIVNIGASVSHTSVVGNFVTISPGARIAGDCTIGDGVFIGIGAIISHGVSIAEGTVIGAGAVVISDIEVAGVYVGVPARRIREVDGWLHKL